MFACASLSISRRWPERSPEEARRVCHQSPQAKKIGNHPKQTQTDKLCSNVLTPETLRRDQGCSHRSTCSIAKKHGLDNRRTNKRSELLDLVACNSIERSASIRTRLPHDEDNRELLAALT